MTSLIIGAFILFVAGVVQGCTGFGMALVAAPVLFLVMPGKAVVPTVVICSMLNSLLVAVESRKHIDWAVVVPLLAGGLIGSPLGVHALKVLDDTHLKVGVGLFVVLVSLALLAGWRMPIGGGKRTMVPVGLLSGFCGGSTSMGGPPIVLFLANRDTPKDLFRANLVCYFSLINVVTICALTYRGLLTGPVALKAAFFFPTMLLGTALGVYLSRRMPEGPFRKAVMLLVGFTGLSLLVTNVMKLF